jgi:hypothetical protein
MTKQLMVDEIRIPAFAAKADIEQKNYENESLYSTSRKAQAERFAAAVREAYPLSTVYVNYRQKFIAVKVDRPLVTDRNRVQVAAIDTYAFAQKYQKVKTLNAVIYRIK